VQQPGAEHPQLLADTKTEWQSLRPSHSVCVVTWLQLSKASFGPASREQVPSAQPASRPAGQRLKLLGLPDKPADEIGGYVERLAGKLAAMA